jgi:homoserine dehydrogenase
MSAPLRVALAGCGTVGGALLDLLDAHGLDLARRRGARLEIVKILVRDTSRPRGVRVPRALLTDDASEFIATPADIVVEAIGGIAVAGRIARESLLRGRRVVTANKALLRAAGPELATLADRHRHEGAALDCEAAVGGGVPIVRLLRESLAGQGLVSVRGVLNGTTNFVLSRIERGATFERAVKDAQRAGFAEADPSRDLDGVDAADKIAVLAWMGFGVDPTSLPVRIRPLPSDVEAAVRCAAARGRSLRVLATARRIGETIHAHVAPALVPRDHPFARAVDEENVVQVVSDSAGLITVSGRGAGGSATASALLADILRAAAPIPSLTAA